MGSVPSDLPASVRSRASGHFAPSPPARGPATLVAMKSEARSAEFVAERAASQRPMISSDAPHHSGLHGTGYISATSRKSPPSAT